MNARRMPAGRGPLLALGVGVLGFYVGLTWLSGLTEGIGPGAVLSALVVPLAFVAVAVALEMALFDKDVRTALRDIGLTRFDRAGVRIAVLYVLPLAAFLPVVHWVTGAPLELVPDWPWLLVRIVAANGLAEEVVMRGVVFRHLREGRPFWRAAGLSTLYFVAYHLPLIFTEGPLVGVLAVVVAIPIGLLTAYLYERGNGSIWGPAFAHAATNGLAMLVVPPNEIRPAVSALYLLLSTCASTLIVVTAYRRERGHP